MNDLSPVVQTTGHIWDGDIQEFNNPVPRNWLLAFYGAVVFVLIYWLFYPSWPLGEDYTKGILNRVSYQAGSGKIVTHWNSRGLLLHDRQQNPQGRAALLRSLLSVDYATAVADPKWGAFTDGVTRSLWGDQCGGCHGEGLAKGETRRPEVVVPFIIAGHNGKLATTNHLSPGEVKALAIYLARHP